jgi:hypothetical protein
MKLNYFIRTVFLLPFLSLLFAYFELGGNWFAYKMLDMQTLWSVGGTIIFSTAYSFIAASVAVWRDIDLGLLMVNYGFGFSIISLVLKLEWNKIPEFTMDIFNQQPSLAIVLAIAFIGFLASGWLIITAPRKSSDSKADTQ